MALSSNRTEAALEAARLASSLLSNVNELIILGGSLSKFRKASAAGFKVDSTAMLEGHLVQSSDTNLYAMNSAQTGRVKKDPIDF